MRPWVAHAIRLIRRIPLFGRAVDSSLSEHSQTAQEILAGLFLSMLPIWVQTFVAFVKGTVFGWQELRSAFGGSVAGGELFIYAAAFLAPIFWIVHSNPPGAREFPSSLAHTVLTAIIAVFAALSFELQRSGQIQNPSIIHTLAVWCFWAAVILIYLATLYHNHRLPSRLPEEIRGQSTQFLENYEEHRR